MKKERVIRLATSDFYSSFKTLFPEVEVFNPEQDAKLDIDLLIFSGGEDVQPSLYVGEQAAKQYEDIVYTNPNRDAKESKIFDLFMKGILTVNKVFGVCRGLQFINVMLGGTLYPDLPSVEKGHRAYHKIIHNKNHPLNYLNFVNSLHHQGLYHIEGYHKSSGKEFDAKVISYEENTGIPEIVTWNSGQILGVQFHPEFFVDNTEVKRTFIEVMDKWIK